MLHISNEMPKPNDTELDPWIVSYSINFQQNINL